MSTPKIKVYVKLDTMQMSFDNKKWINIPDIDSLPISIALADSYITDLNHVFGEGIFDEVYIEFIVTHDEHTVFPCEFELMVYNDTLFNVYIVSDKNGVSDLKPHTGLRYHFFFLNYFTSSSEVYKCGNSLKDIEYKWWDKSRDNSCSGIAERRIRWPSNAYHLPDLSTFTHEGQEYIVLSNANRNQLSPVYDQNGKMIDLRFRDTEFTASWSNKNFFTGKITNMDWWFSSWTDFNGDISYFDTSNVTSLKGTFDKCKFNGDISLWDVSKVKDMSYMFNTSEFSGDISCWDTSNVENMSYMFYNGKFHGDLSRWKTDKLINISYMFYSNKNNNKTINMNGWKLKNTNASFLFYDTDANIEANDWVVDNTNLRFSLYGIDENSIVNLNNWDINNCVLEQLLSNSGRVVNGCFASLNNWVFSGDNNLTAFFNSFIPINNNYPKISNWLFQSGSRNDLNGMFSDTWFNEDISPWNYQTITSMRFLMFKNPAFNQDLSSWNMIHLNPIDYVDYDLEASVWEDINKPNGLI